MAQTEFEKWIEMKSKKTRRGPASRAGKKSSSLEPKEPKTQLKHGLARRLSAEEKSEKIKVKREKQKERAKRPRKKKTPEQRAVKKLDTIFSKVIHKRDSVEGKGTCFTCDEEAPETILQTGHMFSCRYMNIRWHLDNAHLQCNHCNVDLGGNYAVYHERFIAQFGQEAFDEIKRLRDEPFTLNLEDLKKQMEIYTAMLSQS